MVITSVRVQNYRSYSDDSFEFDSGANIIVGPNACGKTNLLDALYLVAQGSSIKSNDSIINYKNNWARIDGLTNTNQSRVVKISNLNSKPVIVIDGKPYKRLPLDKRLPIVLFEPNQLFLLTASPDMRRHFIDDILSKINKEFIVTKNRFQKILQQRNHLLKQPLFEIKEQIFAWDVRLCELAGNYFEKRNWLMDKFNQKISGIYSKVAKQTHNLSLIYDSVIDINAYAQNLLKLLQDNLEKDHLRGFTGYGPHRDDIKIIINNNDIRTTASRGETRSVLLALKIVEAQILEDTYNQKPLLLLDDVFGELDGIRRKSLIDFINDNQAFITTTDADIITNSFTSGAKIIATG